MPAPSETTEARHGGFSIWQDGIKVAGGSGPYEAMQSEAAHYAWMYEQDGPVKVRVWKNPIRSAGHE